MPVFSVYQGIKNKYKSHLRSLCGNWVHFTHFLLEFIFEFLIDGNGKQAALRIGIPETYAARYGQWLKKRPIVLAVLEREIDAEDLRKMKKALLEIDRQMEICKAILGVDEL